MDSLLGIGISSSFVLFSLGCKNTPLPVNEKDVEIPERPNFVFIITEDIGCYLPCYGDSTVALPNVEKLAGEGMILAHAYSTAGVCAPSRSALITGMYPTSIGSNNMRTRLHPGCDVLPIHEYEVVPPPEVKCFTHHLREKGYYCTNQGKRDWQFGAMLAAFNDYGYDGAHWRNREEGQPFFCIFNIFDTHESQIWEREDRPMLCDTSLVEIPPYYPETKPVHDDVARMYSNIIEMDKKVGHIINQLEEDQLLDSTFVFFISDHGGPLPRQKREILDAGLHVPLIIRFPGGKNAGTRFEELVSFIDLAPTVLSLANIQIPDYLQGQAFLGEQKGIPRKYVFGARDRMDTEYDRSRSVSDGKFVYVKNYHPELPWIQEIKYREQMDIMHEIHQLAEENKLNNIQQQWIQPNKPQVQLYNTIEDPYEIKNLANEKKYREKQNELRIALDEWIAKYDQWGDIPEYEMVQEMWPGFKQPETADPKIISQKDSIYISCVTEGASIVYHIAGSLKKPDPSEPNAWNLYTGPVKIDEHKIIYALAERIGYKQSNVISYQIKH